MTHICPLSGTDVRWRPLTDLFHLYLFIVFRALTRSVGIVVGNSTYGARSEISTASSVIWVAIRCFRKTRSGHVYNYTHIFVCLRKINKMSVHSDIFHLTSICYRRAIGTSRFSQWRHLRIDPTTNQRRAIFILESGINHKGNRLAFVFYRPFFSPLSLSCLSSGVLRAYFSGEI